MYVTRTEQTKKRNIDHEHKCTIKLTVEITKLFSHLYFFNINIPLAEKFDFKMAKIFTIAETNFVPTEILLSPNEK